MLAARGKGDEMEERISSGQLNGTTNIIAYWSIILTRENKCFAQ